MEKDWRLTNQMNYLYKATLKKAAFVPSETNDHEHCVFCFDKFGEEEEFLKSGYCTLDEYHWICPTCFRDFQKQFAWDLKDEISDNSSS